MQVILTPHNTSPGITSGKTHTTLISSTIKDIHKLTLIQRPKSLKNK